MLFRDIIGNSSVTQKLRQTFTSGKLGHAYMFTGKEGYGTLPVALALSRYIMCTNRSEEDACGECKSCRKFDKWAHPDIHFVFPVININGKDTVSDAFILEWYKFLNTNCYGRYEDWIKTIASDNKQGGIFKDESAMIAKKLSMKSFESDYKIMIIWMAEKMNETVSNKILKLLEEPPPKTFFFLIVSRPEQILQTVISRTQIIRIPPIEKKEIVRHLKQERNIEESKAEDIAIFSEGDYDRVIDIIDRNDDLEQNAKKVQTFLSHCQKEQIAEIEKFIDNNVNGKIAQIEFLQYILYEYRKKMITNTTEIKFDTSQNNSDSSFPIIQARNVYKLINEAIIHIERNVNSKIVFMDLSIKIRKILKK